MVQRLCPHCSFRGKLRSWAHQVHGQLPHPPSCFWISGLVGQFLAELLTVLLLAVAPTPVHPGFGEVGIGHHISHPFSGQGLGDIAAGDVFLEPGEDRLEGLGGVAEQRGIRHTAGVERGEGDPRVPVQTAMQLLSGDHVAELAVFVGLAGLERLATGHGDGIFEPSLKPREVPQICRCRDRNLAPQFLGVRQPMNYQERAAILADTVIKYQELVLVYQARERDFAMYSHRIAKVFKRLASRADPEDAAFAA